MDVAGVWVSLPGALALGVLIGLVAGMFGIGGGVLMTPLLAVVFRIPLPVAVGTGLCQMIGTSTAALLRHRKIGQGDDRFAALLVGGSLVGVAAGARAVAALEAAGEVAVGAVEIPVVTLVLYLGYLVFLLVVALVLLRQGEGGVEELEYVRRGPLSRIPLPPYVDLPAASLSQVPVLVVAYVGLLLGLLSGLLGVGGGVALIPVLLYGFGFSFRQAAGTGVAVMLLTSTVGTVVHATQDNVHLKLAMVLLVGSSLSAQVGALLTQRLSTRMLRRGLALVVFVTMGAILWDLSARLVG